MGELAWVSGHADVLVGASCALPVALCCWLLLGWDARDARECVARILSRFLGGARSLGRAAVSAVRSAGARLGLVGGEGGQVELGEVSEMIDIVRLGLSAGLSFDASFGLYCEGRESVLAGHMSRALLSWRTGIATREEALLAMAHRAGVRALEPFAIASAQALELGAPLTETLAAQGREIRAAHRAEVERQIERAPVKLLIPTGTLILPALLISIMGPLLAAGGML